MALAVPELVELVLDHFFWVSELYQACFINKTFSEAAIPRLYRSLMIGQAYTGAPAVLGQGSHLGLTAASQPSNFATSLIAHAPHILELSLGLSHTQATVALLKAATWLVSLTLYLGTPAYGAKEPGHITRDLLRSLPIGIEYLDLVVKPGNHDAAGFRELLHLVPASLVPRSLGLVGIDDAKLAVVAAERLGRQVVDFTMLGRRFHMKEPLPYSQCQDLFASLPKPRATC